MMDKNFVDIELLESQLNRVFLIKNTSFSAIRLLFLKYVTDNYMGAETKEDMQYFAHLQKTFAARNVEGGPNPICPVLRIVDNHYKLDNLISDSVEEYAKELFGLDSGWNRKTTSVDDFIRIMDILASFDLEEKDELHTKGKAIVDALIKNIQLRSIGNRNVSENLSKKEIGEIAEGILQVKNEDIFLDFVSGAGSSTIAIVKDRKCRIVNYDIQKESITAAAMLCIMYGYTNFIIRCENTLANPNSEILANKIFVDPPFGLKINSFGQRKDSVLIAIDKTIDCLSQNGIGIVTTNSGLLFGTAKPQIESKRKLVDNKYLQAVISLPINAYGTLININLLIISKRENSDVLFVNGNCKTFAKYVQKERNKDSISKEGIDLIIDLVNNNKTFEDISKAVSYNEIADNNYNFLPNAYLKEKTEEETLTIEEIDKELATLYAQLGIK